MNKTIKEFYSDLLKINNSNDFQSNKADAAADLMLDLQGYLINNAIITSDLFPSILNNEEERIISDIFLKIRRNFQNDNEETQDFSYLGVADEWLLVNNVKIHF